jgi:hypothetical protein
MVRAAVLSIVLTLTTGPNAMLLCSVWCHPWDAAAAPCAHQGATTAVRASGEEGCKTFPASVTALLREETRGGSPTGGFKHALAPILFRFAVPPIDTTPLHETATSAAAAGPPASIALRI